MNIDAFIDKVVTVIDESERTFIEGILTKHRGDFYSVTLKAYSDIADRLLESVIDFTLEEVKEITQRLVRDDVGSDEYYVTTEIHLCSQ